MSVIVSSAAMWRLEIVNALDGGALPAPTLAGPMYGSEPPGMISLSVMPEQLGQPVSVTR